MHVLDNPVWESLTSDQSDFSLGGQYAKRYPAEFGPFVAIEGPGTLAFSELETIVGSDELVFLAGIAPPLPPVWEIVEDSSMLQMVCKRRADDPVNGDISTLTQVDVPEMLALTGLAFPGFFRNRTRELGTYLGIRVNSTLVAMAGERMMCRGFREISAVCTHPEWLRRGMAGRLVAQLVNSNLEQRLTPFLHVGHGNERAQWLYKKLGFVKRASIRLLLIRKASSYSTFKSPLPVAGLHSR